MAFFKPVSDDAARQWISWLNRWLAHGHNVSGMKEASPRIVPREWMLVEAYKASNSGDYSVAEQLHNVLLNPYADNLEKTAHRYLAFKPELVEGVGEGGTAYMT